MNDSIFNVRAEQSVLGSMLIDSACVRVVLEKVREEDFSIERNRLLFSSLQSMDLAGNPIDVLTVADHIKADNSMRSYLAELVEVTPTSANVEEYADIVRETAQRRRLRQSLMDAVLAIDDRRPDSEIFPYIDAAVNSFDDRSRSGISSPVEQCEAFMNHRRLIDGGVPPFVPTGFESLDNMLGGGLLNGCLFYLAARPGTGKTALSINVADFVANHSGPTLLVSMEMSKPEIMARRVANRTGIDSRKLLMKQLTEKEYDEIAKALIALGSTPLRMLAEGSVPVRRIYAAAHACNGLRCLIIDHFTLLSRPHTRQDFSEHADNSHELMNLARRLNIPVFCLIQVSRDDSFGKKKRTRLESLRGSGATEEDAAGVLFIENVGEVRNVDGEPREERLILEKYRFGPTGEISLSYRPRENKFVEINDPYKVAREFSVSGKTAKLKNSRNAQITLPEVQPEKGEVLPF